MRSSSRSSSARARPSKGLEELFKLGVLGQLFPELEALALVIQDSVFHPEKDAFGHHTVWHHTKLSVDQAAAIARMTGLAEPKALTLLLAALYHDLGKRGTTRWEYKRGRMAITSCGHDILSGRMAEKVLARFRIHSWNGYRGRPDGAPPHPDPSPGGRARGRTGSPSRKRPSTGWRPTSKGRSSS